MKTLRIGWVVSSVLAFACSVDDVTAPPPGVDGGADGGGSADAAPGSDTAIADASNDTAPTDQPLLRFADLSPDAPALDFCLAPHGTTTYMGPVVASAAPDAGAAGLSFGQVTAHLALGLQSGIYDVRTVAAGAADCTDALMGVANATNLATLAAGERYTIAALGETSPASGDHPYAVLLLGDDAVASEAAVRFLHASPGNALGAVDVGTGTLTATDAAPADFQPWFTHVTYGLTGLASVADGGTVDSDGYLGIAPFSSMTVSAHPSGGTADTVTATGLSFASGSVSTLFLIGGKSGDTTNPVELLLCADDAEEPSGALLAPCSVVSQ